MRAIPFFLHLDELTRKHGIYAYTTRMLFDCVLTGESARARQTTLARAVKTGILVRYCRGVYAFRMADCPHDIRQEAVIRLRHGHFAYMSCESALAMWGVLDQQTMGALTVMTSGRSRWYSVPNGELLLTHTAKPYSTIAGELVPPANGDKLPMAKPRLAYRDFRRKGGDGDMIDMDMLHHVAGELDRG